MINIRVFTEFYEIVLLEERKKKQNDLKKKENFVEYFTIKK